MISFLNELEAARGMSRSLYIPVGLSLAQVKSLVEEHFRAQAVPVELASLVVSSRTGAVFLWSQPRQYLVLPPFPVREERFVQGYAVGRLRAMLERDFRIALVLVRLGSYAVGVCEGERLITSKVGTGLVHGRHRQGGSSAQRFHLRREKQIDSFLDRVCGHIAEQLGPEVPPPDYLACGGARMTILQLRKRCPLLGRFEDCTLPPLLDIPEPRQAVLEAVVGRVWSSRVVEWQERETAKGKKP